MKCRTYLVLFLLFAAMRVCAQDGILVSVDNAQKYLDVPLAKEKNLRATLAEAVAEVMEERFPYWQWRNDLKAATAKLKVTLTVSRTMEMGDSEVSLEFVLNTGESILGTGHLFRSPKTDKAQELLKRGNLSKAPSMSPSTSKDWTPWLKAAVLDILADTTGDAIGSKLMLVPVCRDVKFFDHDVTAVLSIPWDKTKAQRKYDQFLIDASKIDATAHERTIKIESQSTGIPKKDYEGNVAVEILKVNNGDVDAFSGPLQELKPQSVTWKGRSSTAAVAN